MCPQPVTFCPGRGLMEQGAEPTPHEIRARKNFRGRSVSGLGLPDFSLPPPAYPLPRIRGVFRRVSFGWRFFDRDNREHRDNRMDTGFACSRSVPGRSGSGNKFCPWKRGGVRVHCGLALAFAYSYTFTHPYHWRGRGGRITPVGLAAESTYRGVGLGQHHGPASSGTMPTARKQSFPAAPSARPAACGYTGRANRSGVMW